MIYKLGFSQRQLFTGSLISTIVHAVWTANEPAMAGMHAWDGQNYLLNDMSGTIGAVSFDGNIVVGTLFDAKSPRNPIPDGTSFNKDRYFNGSTAAIKNLAEKEALQYMLQHYRGETVPLTTAAFWSLDGELVANEPWCDVREHGGHILDLHIIDREAAFRAWQIDKSLSTEQIEIAHSLFERKIESGTGPLRLSATEKDYFKSGSGWPASQELLTSIGFEW